MEMPQVRKAEAAELDKVLHTVTLAFSADPLMRWIFPPAPAYLDSWPGLVRAYCGSAVAAGTSWITADHGGAALWMAPGTSPDEELMGAYIAEHIRPEILEEFGALLGAMDEYHPHDEPCWYLAFIGVDNAHQGKGLGGALMKTMTQLLDKEGTLAYLESSNPANISLYERHGFERMGEIRVGSAPLVTPMIRHPR